MVDFKPALFLRMALATAFTASSWPIILLWRFVSKFNNFHDKINELISIYNSLDLAFCPSIANKLNNQKDRIVKIKEEMLSSKNKIKKILEKIESIEDEINVRVSKMNLDEIKEVDIKEFM